MALLIRTTSLTGFSELVSRLNGYPETLLESFNLAPQKVANLEGVLPYRTKINLIEEVAKQLQRSDFDLMLAQEQDLMVLGPLAVVALNSPTVKEAVRNIIQYMHYHSPGLQMSLAPRVTANTHTWFSAWMTVSPGRARTGSSHSGWPKTR